MIRIHFGVAFCPTCSPSMKVMLACDPRQPTSNRVIADGQYSVVSNFYAALETAGLISSPRIQAGMRPRTFTLGRLLLVAVAGLKKYEPGLGFVHPRHCGLFFHDLGHIGSEPTKDLLCKYNLMVDFISMSTFPSRRRRTDPEAGLTLETVGNHDPGIAPSQSVYVIFDNMAPICRRRQLLS